jgi:hypothetical protein
MLYRQIVVFHSLYSNSLMRVVPATRANFEHQKEIPFSDKAFTNAHELEPIAASHLARIAVAQLLDLPIGLRCKTNSVLVARMTCDQVRNVRAQINVARKRTCHRRALIFPSDERSAA